jgi:hypothetical protein
MECPSTTIYHNELTNNDVLLLPINGMNIKMDLVDLSSIVEGIEEDGDEGDMTASFPHCGNSQAVHNSNRATSSSLSPPCGSNLPPRDGLNLEKAFLDHFGNIDEIFPEAQSSAAEMKTDLIDISIPDPDPIPTIQFASNKHPGNNRFYVLISLYRKAFMKASEVGSTTVCDQIAEKIIRSICAKSVPNGRFLECNADSWSKTTYKQLDVASVNEIVKWALREPPKAEVAEYLSAESVKNEKADKRRNDHTSSQANSHKIPNQRAQNTLSAGDIHVTNEQFHNKSIPNFTYQRRSSAETVSEAEENWEDESTNPGSTSSNPSISSFRRQGRSSRSSNSGRKRRPRRKEKTSKLKRRGEISSNETMGKKSKGKINLADIRFAVSGPLSKLVEEVFSAPVQTEATCMSEVSESGTPSVSRLGHEIGHVRIQDHSDGGTATGAEKQESIRVRTHDGNLRDLGQFDVLCTSSMRLHSVNHLGNNRFRTMLQMHRQSFHHPRATPADKREISIEIANQVMSGKKGQGRLLQERQGFWVEIDDSEVQPTIQQFLEQCGNDMGLSLPSLHLASSKSLTSPLEEKSGYYKNLHVAALESIKSRKKKKDLRLLDSRSIDQLHSQILEQRYDTN